MDNPSEARRRIHDYLKRRMAAVLDAMPGEPTLMLSGGIDSVTLAAAMRALGSRPLCVTVSVEGVGATDSKRAETAVSNLGLEHLSIELTPNDVVERAVSAAQAIGTDEIWEVGAATTIFAVFEAIGRGGGGYSAALDRTRFLQAACC